MARRTVSQAVVGLLRSLAASVAPPQRRSGPVAPRTTSSRSDLGVQDGIIDLTNAEIRALEPGYEPDPDGSPDPGEIVWAWVPYAEHDGRGKDRPVLIIARIDARTTAGCALSTKQHRGFVSVGSGGWDAEGRESFLATDRVLRVPEDAMRREGHVLPRDRFVDALAAVMRAHGVRRQI
ncbi:type II toxin-antitoxin system PemK/MazF family toxin [Leucobacter chromiiresistens]|uniref:PemK-like, MazF-like toxin of type II toxin-antitoxin system n=1 Tax=Leucobacter chromiiresistens TaxID=1079994 RepID=A0A1H0ZW91_9MICO|nr:type II toxin-antitoxin system PemK/MazF family toxin [Leucobacter chromiiresistens]SDQ31663.1 PemK-like, MazF-like toxin of type II toxin-antitoxin system [Leucobacter chromiiresistens]